MNRHRVLTIKPQQRFGLVLLIVLAAIGCGGHNTGKVSGTVTYQGKPLPKGAITFLDSSNRELGIALIQGGKDAMPPPLPVGPIKITVKEASLSRARHGHNRMPKGPPPKGKAGVPSPPFSDVHIPAQYADPDQSGLTYTVRSGEQVHNIELP